MQPDDTTTQADPNAVPAEEAPMTPPAAPAMPGESVANPDANPAPMPGTEGTEETPAADAPTGDTTAQ